MVLRKWSRESVKDGILARLESGKEMNASAVVKNDQGLFSAAQKRFGGWNNALKAAGLDPEKYQLRVAKGYWSENPQARIVGLIKKLEAAGEDLSATSIYNNHGPLHDAALKYLGSWENAVRMAGFDYDSLRRQRKPYTKKELLDRLRQLQFEGFRLDWSSIRNYDQNLAMAIVSRFGGYGNAIRELGLDYDDVRKDWDTENKKGELFELLVLKVLITLGQRIEYQKRFKYKDEQCVVDFVNVDNGEWLDAKLNSWTPEIDKTIMKYLRHTDKLTIIHLKDSRRRKTHWAGERVLFMPVRGYYPRLLDLGAKDLVLSIERLRRTTVGKGDLRKQLESTYSELEAEIELPLTEVSIVARLKELERRGEDIGPKNLPVKFRQAGIDLFGGTWEMYEAADIDPARFFNRPRYTKKVLLKIVTGRYESGKSLKHHDLAQEYPGITQAIVSVFGNSANLYRAANIPLSRHVIRKPPSHAVDRMPDGFWDKESNIIAVLKKRYNEGKDMRRHAAIKDSTALVNRAERHFDGWYNALEAAGIDPLPFQSGAPKGFWTEDRILNEIRLLNAKHEDLSDATVRKNGSQLYNAAKRRFKGWSAALEAAGVSSVEYRKKKSWDNDAVVSTLRKLQSEGKNIRPGALHKTNPGLLAAGERIFGSSRAMYEAAGIEPAEIALPHAWDKTTVKSELRKRYESGADMRYGAVRKGNSRLMAACENHFGSYFKSLEAAEIPVEKIRVLLPRGYWTEDRIRNEIRTMARGGEELNDRCVQLQHGPLYSAAQRVFGSWKMAVEASGYEYDLVRKQRKPYTREGLLETLRSLSEQGVPLDLTSVRRYDRKLIDAIIRVFGDYRHGIEALGLDSEKVRRK